MFTYKNVNSYSIISVVLQIQNLRQIDQRGFELSRKTITSKQRCQHYKQKYVEYIL